jgi:hypothetical protein
MKKIVLSSIILLMVACTATPTSTPEATYKAIYLVQENGQLSKADLQAHPEVRVTSSFEEFRKLAKNKTSLWIDVNAVKLVDKDWLKEKPQRFYPIVFIGFSDTLCAFRETLGGFGIIQGPYVDCSSPPPGYSIWMLEEENSSSVSAFMRGYEEVPTVKNILEKTDPLLSKP